MTIEEMKSRKRELGYTNSQIAAQSGVPLGTVQKIFSGETTSPRYETIQALEKTLGRQKSLSHSFEADMYIREAATAYGKQDFTASDFYSMPEDWKGELIDGTLYNMSSPTYLHQLLAQLISRQLEEYVWDHNGKCLVLGLPVNTHLDADEKTVVEPDITVLCDRSKLHADGRIYGAPDLIVEILSPSTKRTDLLIKMPKYLRAGVREYWIVDPDAKTIHVYIPEAKIIPMLYSFEDSVPVGIWDGKCEVNFGLISERVRILYQEEN